MPETLKEGAQVEQELEELAAPEVSETEPEVQQPSPAPAGLTEERLQELLVKQQTALEETIERKLQSTKDRRISKIESKVDELLTLREQVEAAGGWDQVINQRKLEDDLETRLSAMLDARIPQAQARQPVANQKEAWRAEWEDESKKITDAAAQLGVKLTPEEYNAALFGKKFETKGDAYAALNRALLQKGAGEAITAAAVVTEGGTVARPKEPEAPKDHQQLYEEAMAKGDEKAARASLDAQWAEIEKMQAKERAKSLLAQSGLTPEDLSD